MAHWHTTSSVRAEDAHGRVLWLDAESIHDETLAAILHVAMTQVNAYAPLAYPDASDDVPETFRYAQLQQAINLYNAGRVDANGGVGDGGDFVMRPHPLDWHIKAIIRPKVGRPRVG